MTTISCRSGQLIVRRLQLDRLAPRSRLKFCSFSMMTDEKLAAPDWPLRRRDSHKHGCVGHGVERAHRKRTSLFNCVRATAAAAALFYLLLHSQIIPSNQQELLLLQPGVGASGEHHQLVHYGSSARAAGKQITRRSYSAGQSGGQSPDAPKLIPLSALDRYQEGTDLRLFCSASAPKSAGRLYFEWRRNQNELLASSGSVPSTSSTFSGGSLSSSSGLDEITGPSTSSSPQAPHKPRLQISMMDESASVLRIGALEASDAGNYTCLVRNQQGFDSSTVGVNILVKMKWIVEPPGELQVRAGKLVQLECDASGQPAPLISWTSLKDHQTINSKLLRIDRVSTNDSGMYECRATRPMAANSGGQHQQQQQHRDHGSEQLRKIVRLIVNGKC